MTQDNKLGWKRLSALAADHGQSFFILDLPRFQANFRALKAAFTAHYPSVEIGYSYKTNYTPHLCQAAHAEGGYAEIVSEMEYAAAKRLNIPGNRIIYNGPYKADWSFHEAAQSGAILNLDSLRDIHLLKTAAQTAPSKTFNVVVRTNFAISDSTSRFGFDIDGGDFQMALSAIRDIPNAELRGLHCHFPDRDLESFRKRAHGLVDLTRQVFPDTPPDILNIGGGFFSNMPESLRRSRVEPPATFAEYGEAVGSILSTAFEGQSKWPTLFLEPGTAIVADCQTFYTQVISTKAIRGKHIATVAGSIFDISPNAKSKVLPVTAIHAPENPAVNSDPFAIAGYTCIEGDILTEAINAPLQKGDFLAYDNVGSYSVVMRPPFILPSNPILMNDGSGKLRLIKERQTNDDVFRHFKAIE